MKNDRKLVISVGQSRRSTNWIRTEMMWSEFIDRLRTPQRTPETIEEYLNMTKAQQGQLKDIGGFVGGALNGTQRKAKNVTGRDLVTLDLDNIANGETANVLRKIDSLGAGYAVYSTRSHAEFRPRLRVIMPLDRTVTADEYEPIARKLASYIGLEMCDPTTFDASRLMYWPACSSDSQYVFNFADKSFISADGILKLYTDWHDVSVWPQVPGEANKAKTLLAKQQDPTSKEGIVGAFCREFNIYQAIERFIPHAYDTTEHDDRLTYTGGSTVAGAVIYDGGNFLYSHHATDPCSGQLVNAFDLVRLHLFGDKDEAAKPGTPANKLPSYQEMKKLALGNEAVARDLNQHYAAQASDFFTNLDTAGEGDKQHQPDVNWMAEAKLDYDQNTGRPKKTRDKIMKILQHDPALKGKIAVDDFAVRGLALGALPWNPAEDRRLWTDTDDAGVAWWLETRYDITGREKIDGALLLVSEANKINEVKDYLTSLEWDKTPRLDTVLSDYLGADDTPYTRAVARKSLTAAVVRVMQPGCKYDYCLILTGPEGAGKSTLLSKMGGSWFNDSITTTEGKEGMDQLRGAWIIEIGELASIRRSDVESVKAFLSKRIDIYRAAYDRRKAEHPRQCVFCGTTNEALFLKGDNGNRRFWVIAVDPALRKYKDWQAALDRDRDQLWAEAVEYYRRGEKLYLDDRLEAKARRRQEAYNDDSDDPMVAMLRKFLDMRLPADWPTRDIQSRRNWLHSPDDIQAVGVEVRARVCAAEFVCEQLRRDMADKEFKYLTRKVSKLIADMPNWERVGASRHADRWYGVQKAFERINDVAEDDL